MEELTLQEFAKSGLKNCMELLFKNETVQQINSEFGKGIEVKEAEVWKNYWDHLRILLLGFEDKMVVH